MITYSFIHYKYFLKLNINFEDVSWFSEKVMIKFHEKVTHDLCLVI